MLNSSEREDLELLVDTYGLGDVIEALHDLCHEKASHLEENWQDKNAAKAWERDAAKLIKLAPKLEN